MAGVGCRAASDGRLTYDPYVADEGFSAVLAQEVEPSLGPILFRFVERVGNGAKQNRAFATGLPP